MGQNGAGKSSILKLLNGTLTPTEGAVNTKIGARVATARQTMPPEFRELTVDDFFAAQFSEEEDPGAELPSMIAAVLNDVKLDAPSDRLVRSFSGGQQARLLLAAALIKDAQILLLDEPTNNLDAGGIRHLRKLIQETDQTVVVISHDEAFLNSFTDSVLYLDIFSKKVEMYNGDYMFVKAKPQPRAI